MKIFELHRWYADIKSLRTIGLRKRMELRALITAFQYHLTKLFVSLRSLKTERAEELWKHILSTYFVFSELDVAAYERSLFKGSNERLRKGPSNKRKSESRWTICDSKRSLDSNRSNIQMRLIVIEFVKLFKYKVNSLIITYSKKFLFLIIKWYWSFCERLGRMVGTYVSVGETTWSIPQVFNKIFSCRWRQVSSTSRP